MTMKSVVISCLFLLFFLNIGSKPINGSILKTVENLPQEFIKSMHDISLTNFEKCECRQYICYCCFYLEFDPIGLNDTLCFSVLYLPNEYGLEVKVTVDNHTIFDAKVSLKNPPPICFGAPFTKELAEVCVLFYDLDATKQNVHGCAKVEAEMAHVSILEEKLGCFNIPLIKGKDYTISGRNTAEGIHVQGIRKISELYKISNLFIAVMLYMAIAVI